MSFNIANSRLSSITGRISTTVDSIRRTTKKSYFLSISSAADLPAKLEQEKQLRALRARRRFKAAIRNVIYNLYWMQDSDDIAIGDIDIDKADKETIKRIVALKSKKDQKTIAGKLTIRERAILRKPMEYRTEEEKQLLFKVLGGLKCFRRYPENIQFQLVACSYFVFFASDTIILKQNQNAHAMYFILSGEVIITKEMYDEIENTWTVQELGRVPAGNGFGEVSLLHNTPRSANVITASPCELLMLTKADFNEVLKDTIQASWDEIEQAMKKFSYFDSWSNIATRECCILSRIKSYEENQIILGDGVGKSSQKLVYFVIEGNCSVVEHFFVEEIMRRGTMEYKIYDPSSHEISLLDVSSDVNEMLYQKKFSTSSIKMVPSQKDFMIESIESLKYSENTSSIDIVLKQVKESTIDLPTISQIKQMCQSNKNDMLMNQMKRRIKQIDPNNLPANVKLRFMQVCIFGEKATFTNNSLLTNRRVIALTPVRCILIPAYWLSQHNYANVWVRVSQFLKWRIPSHKEVFKKYVQERKWEEYRKKLVESIMKGRTYNNNTTIHDVPYSIRVLNELD